MKLAKFEGANVRMHDFDGKTWYSVVDIITILTESDSPSRYWTELRDKLKKEGGQLFGKIEKFKMLAADGKMRSTECLYNATEKCTTIEQVFATNIFLTASHRPIVASN